MSLPVLIELTVEESPREIELRCSEPEAYECTVAEKIVTTIYPEYDGPAAVTPSHEAQTIPTAGTVVSEDITVEAIPATTVDVTDTTATPAEVKSGKLFHLPSGSPAVGSLVWDFKGDEPEFVERFYNSGKIALKDTSFNGWTPSTTAKAIKATASVKSLAADMANYEYLIRWRCRFDAAYNDGATLKAQLITECAEIWQVLFRRPNSLAALASADFAGNTCATFATIPLNVYFNTSGARTYTYSASYGIYPSATAATFSSASADDPTVTIKTPTYNARCSSTYFATVRAPELDQKVSTFTIIGELYRVKRGSAMRAMYTGLIELYNQEE